MQIEVQANSNCVSSEQFVFSELGPARLVSAIRVLERGVETRCDVTGVDAEGKFIPAQAVKIADSGAGYAYLIFGGSWGIRLRPERYKKENWDLSNLHQWGESFKIYGEEEDIFYGNIETHF